MFELNLASLPNYVLYLEGVQLSYIKVFVHIFNLWYSHKPCFITNAEFAKRTDLHRDTVINAIQFFEKHGVLRREQKGTKRYLIQVSRFIETETVSVDKSPVNGSNIAQGSELDHGGVGVRPLKGSELDHHNNKYNNKYKKSSCDIKSEKANNSVDNSKKHDWATPKPPSFSDPTKQSTSYKHEEYEKPSQETIDAAMLKLPRHMRPKRLRTHEANELPTRPPIQPEVPERPHASPTSIKPATDRKEDFSPPIRSGDRLMAPSSARSYLEKVGMAGA